MTETKFHWVIKVGGYGSFLFEGTEAQAEEMRRHKARWEQGVAKKRWADDDEILTGIVKDCWKHPNFTGSKLSCNCAGCRNSTEKNQSGLPVSDSPKNKGE